MSDKERLTIEDDVGAVDFEDYDEYDEPEWLDDILYKEEEERERESSRYDREPFPEVDEEFERERYPSGTGATADAGETRKGVRERLGEARESHERRAILRRKRSELETERKLSSQISKTRLAELKKKERKAKGRRFPSAKSLMNVATLGGPIKKQNLQLYAGGMPRSYYSPRPLPVSGQSFGAGGQAGGRPSLGLDSMRSLNAPGGISSMRSVVAPGKPVRQSTDSMRSMVAPAKPTGLNMSSMKGLTSPNLGGLRQPSRVRRASSPLANPSLIMPSTRLATGAARFNPNPNNASRMRGRASNLPYKRKLRRLQKEV